MLCKKLCSFACRPSVVRAKRSAPPLPKSSLRFLISCVDAARVLCRAVPCAAHPTVNKEFAGRRSCAFFFATATVNHTDIASKSSRPGPYLVAADAADIAEKICQQTFCALPKHETDVQLILMEIYTTIVIYIKIQLESFAGRQKTLRSSSRCSQPPRATCYSK